MDIHRGSGPLRSGPTGPGSGFSVMPLRHVSGESIMNESRIVTQFRLVQQNRFFHALD